MARKPAKDNPACPDCGGRTISDGKRAHTNIKRFRCKGEIADTKCATKPRRFSELTKEVLLDEAIKAPVPVRDELRDDTHVFLITWAQNATPVHGGFWRALNAAKGHRNADLIVIKGMYRNPTRLNEEADDEYWAPEVMEAGLWDQRVDLCPVLTLLADIPIQPTGKRPLTGLDSHTGGKSGIIGHPKIEMRVVPTPQNALPKQMMTTGACTLRNYSRSKAGKQGEFHHTHGALIVEVRDGIPHIRQLNACRDGSFIDLETEYLPDGTTRPAGRAQALVMGDWHSGFTSPHVIDATFGVGNLDAIVPTLKPEVIFWDDVLDQYSRNHHHRNNPFVGIAKAKDSVYDRNDLRAEVAGACEDINFFMAQARKQNGNTKCVVKASNHDEALTRYIMERSWKNDPNNAEFYLETALEMTKRTTMEDTGASYPDAFQVWLERFVPDAEFTGRRGSYMIDDIEYIFHGDIGPNGARGSIVSFAKIGVKTVIAHSHTPGIVDGCYQVGTSTHLNLEYAKGPSSWMNTHCVTYANGKRALLSIYDGQWRH
jgi:hypothetical protein